MEDDLTALFRQLVLEEKGKQAAAKLKRQRASIGREERRVAEAALKAELARNFSDEAAEAFAEIRTMLQELREANAAILLNGKVRRGCEVTVRVAGRPKFARVIRFGSVEYPKSLGIVFGPNISFATVEEFRTYLRNTFLRQLAREVAASRAASARARLSEGRTWADVSAGSGAGGGVSVSRLGDMLDRTVPQVVALLYALGVDVKAATDLVPAKTVETLLEMRDRQRASKDRR